MCWNLKIMSDSVVLMIDSVGRWTHLSKTTLRAASASSQQWAGALLVHIQKPTHLYHNKSIGNFLDMISDSPLYPLAHGNRHPNLKNFLPRLPIHLKFIRWQISLWYAVTNLDENCTQSLPELHWYRILHHNSRMFPIEAQFFGFPSSTWRAPW